jgi:hypothetical protein
MEASLHFFQNRGMTFCYNIRHLVQCTQPFWYSELCHFGIVELNHFAQSFCGLVSHFATVLCHFLIATVPRHPSLMQCSVIFQLQHCSVIVLFCYSELNHFVILSAIFASLNLAIFCYSAQPFFNCYSAQPFLVDTMLNHFWLLHCSVIFCLLQCSSFLFDTVFSRSYCYNTHSFIRLQHAGHAGPSYVVPGGTELLGRVHMGGRAWLDRLVDRWV